LIIEQEKVLPNARSNWWSASGIDMTTLLQRWRHEALHNRIAVNAKDGSVMVYVPPGEFTMGDGSARTVSRTAWNCRVLDRRVCGDECAISEIRRETDTRHRVRWTMENGCGERAVCRRESRPSGRWRELGGQRGICGVGGMRAGDRGAVGESGAGRWAGVSLGKRMGRKQVRYAGNRGDEETCRVHGYRKGERVRDLQQSGNVWEWCNDWYDWKYYRTSPKRDPQGPDEGRRACIAADAGGTFLGQIPRCRPLWLFSSFSRLLSGLASREECIG